MDDDGGDDGVDDGGGDGGDDDGGYICGDGDVRSIGIVEKCPHPI